MTAPERGTAPVEVQPPPSEDPTAQRIAEILLAAYALDKTIKLIRALLGAAVGEQAVRAALGLASHAVRARPPLSAYDISRRREDATAADIVRTVAADDTYYRAAYIENAARRMQDDLDEGKSFREAQQAEQRNYDAHRRARDKRLDAAAKVGIASKLHGPILGWYRNWALDSDIDCIAADGNNFDARLSTSIGYPGSVHPNCGCSAGPPHENAGTVDDALASWGKPASVETVRRAS